MARARLEVLSYENKALKKELESSQALVESDCRWLRVSQSTAMHDVEVHVRSETTAKYAARLEVIRNYIEARDKLDQAIILLSQCRGMLAILKVLKEDGTQIPEEVLAKFEVDEAGFLGTPRRWIWTIWERMCYIQCLCIPISPEMYLPKFQMVLTT